MSTGWKRRRPIAFPAWLLAFVIALVPFRSALASTPVFDQDPIVFVHGCPPPPFTNEDARDSLARMRDRFAAAGYPGSHLHSILFSITCGSNVTYAEEIAAVVEQVLAQTGAEKVDIVAHSMGALASRLYLKRGGHDLVRDFVSLAGANHGAIVGGVSAVRERVLPGAEYQGAVEMFPIYACEGIQFEVNGCLTPTGRTVAVDETPGDVRHLSIRNVIDQGVPTEASCLNMSRWNDCSDAVNESVQVLTPNPHSDIVADDAVFSRVYEHVTATAEATPAAASTAQWS